MSNPALDDYLRDRINLINGDRMRHRRHMPGSELQADRVVRAIRAKEAETVWGIEHDDVPHPFPGMEFLTVVCTTLQPTRRYATFFLQETYDEEQALQDPTHGKPCSSRDSHGSSGNSCCKYRCQKVHFCMSISTRQSKLVSSWSLPCSNLSFTFCART
ncbi:hypothetical protein J3R83DRAFT_2120 [Lanmaoa asiatica]|nr:hypothetical protein J3R83DRAFT_2120 [Lanmaoa asiatica]